MVQVRDDRDSHPGGSYGEVRDDTELHPGCNNHPYGK